MTHQGMFDDFWNHGLRRLPLQRRESRYWTVFEASRVLELTPPAVRKILKGHPELATHIGGRIKINRAALREFFRKRSDPDDVEYEGIRRG